jgi:membrane protease YdiL (CAAX protease family)
MFAPRRKIAVTPPTGLRYPLAVAAVVTAVATACSYLLPDGWAAHGVGLTFLGATYWLVVRGDDNERIREHGLSLGGLVELEPLSWPRLLKDTARALAYALGAALVIYPFFWLGFRLWWNVDHFHPASLRSVLNDAGGQLLMIALPEEAFYRGYLQTSLERELNKSVNVLGTRLSWGIVLSSAIFAVGHLLTELNPARLAVFFPSLVFGFLRARTRGIGASVLFHALCNLFSAYLIRSYF